MADAFDTWQLWRCVGNKTTIFEFSQFARSNCHSTRGGKETATAVLSDSETILLSLSFRSAVCSVEVEEGGKLMKPTDVSGEALVFDAKRG